MKFDGCLARLVAGIKPAAVSIAAALALAGCANQRVITAQCPAWPEAPAELQRAAPAAYLLNNSTTSPGKPETRP